MKKSSIIRLSLFALCLLFYLWHVVGSTLVNLGLSSQHDITSVIAHNIGRQYEFSITHPGLDGAKLRAYVYLSVNDTDYEIHYRFNFSQLQVDLERFKTLSAFLPADPRIAQVIHIIEDKKNTSFIAQATLTYDDKCRMKSLSASFNALGIEGLIDGTVDHLGFHAQVSSSTLDLEEEFKEPHFNPDNVHAATPLLPPGIKPGDIIQLTPFKQHLQLEVGPREDVFIKQQKISLLRCSLNRNYKNIADIYASENGIIYMIRITGTGVQITLEEVKLDNGDVVWSNDPQAEIVEDIEGKL